MDIRIGMRVKYRDTPSSAAFKYRPKAGAVGSVVGSCGDSFWVKWEQDLCDYPGQRVAYYAAHRLQPLGAGGGF